MRGTRVRWLQWIDDDDKAILGTRDESRLNAKNLWSKGNSVKSIRGLQLAEFLTRCLFLATIKLRTHFGKFGEFWACIAYFWLALVGRNHCVNKKFSKLSMEISDYGS